jgi:hypothetical protein
MRIKAVLFCRWKNIFVIEDKLHVIFLEKLRNVPQQLGNIAVAALHHFIESLFRGGVPMASIFKGSDLSRRLFAGGRFKRTWSLHRELKARSG